MKKQILILFTFFVCLALQTRCHQKKTPSGPEEEEPLTEIVYGDTASANATCPQYDIDWPSLADSPWPMAVVDQQGLSRSSVPVLVQSNYVWSIDLVNYNEKVTRIEYGSAIGPDGTLYIQEEGALNAVTMAGGFLWFLADSFCVESGPIVGRDSTIYCGCINIPERDGCEGGLIAVRPDGTVKWAVNRSENFTEIRPFIGIDGTLYTRNDKGMLYAISPQGDVLWQKLFAPPGWNIITSSPDGSVLYLAGPDYTLVAINAVNGAEFWSESTGMLYFHHASVDNQGNVYFCRAPTATSRELVSVSPEGTVRWNYLFDHEYAGSYIREESPMNGPNVAFNGFIYIGLPEIGVVSFDYNGNLRWKFTPVINGDRFLYNSRQVISDCENNIVCCDSERGTFYKLSTTGDTLSKIKLRAYFPERSPTIGPWTVGSGGTIYIPCGGALFASFL